MKPKSYKVVMHFNKSGSVRNRPWTVHYKGACHLVSHIVCNATMMSEWHPHKRTNPRAYFTAQVSDVTFAHTPVGDVIATLNPPHQ